MTLQERISQWVDAHEAELIRDIGRLVAVKSVRGEPGPDAPFGPGPRAALDEALALCSEYGFATALYGGAVGTADMNALPARVDILGHLDVVAEGAGWDTPPYEAVLKGDGCLYGRGTDDDKGPIVMALFAMRCVRELGLPLRHGCRLIMGTDEESGSADLPYYYSEHAPAPNTFTPDTGFPVYNVEKGMYRPVVTRTWADEEV
uniref:M20/M25/M40 family metallo-hydrolase n=1 Tax=Candidatus Scatomorpha intestinigallinarum TaxID=2840923 RepID=UPI0040294AE4